jgi:hypothetical protein
MRLIFFVIGLILVFKPRQFICGTFNVWKKLYSVVLRLNDSTIPQINNIRANRLFRA